MKLNDAIRKMLAPETHTDKRVYKVAKSAEDALGDAAEHLMPLIFRDALALAQHANRNTVQVKDFKMALSIGGKKYAKQVRKILVLKDEK